VLIDPFQLLEGVGAISAADAKKARSRGVNYQDAVTEPLKTDREDDADTSGRCDEDEREDNHDNILSAVEKASTYVQV
jgi:hypothetical protein